YKLVLDKNSHLGVFLIQCKHITRNFFSFAYLGDRFPLPGVSTGAPVSSPVPSFFRLSASCAAGTSGNSPASASASFFLSVGWEASLSGGADDLPFFTFPIDLFKVDPRSFVFCTVLSQMWPVVSRIFLTVS